MNDYFDKFFLLILIRMTSQLLNTKTKLKFKNNFVFIILHIALCSDQLYYTMIFIIY